MPRQNRPLVRDGRLQTKKKRTDRSYLRPAAAPAPEPEAVDEIEAAVPPEAAELVAAPARARAAAPAVPPTPARAGAARVTGAARAIQQQGVRKRREVDLAALARRDTSYAVHELRRIAILAAMVVTTLIVLGVVLR